MALRRRGIAIVLMGVLTAAVLAAAGCDVPSTGGLGQVGGSGNVITKSYDYSGFTKVVVDSGFEVRIDYADAFDVQVRVDDNLVKDHLKVELDGDTLQVGLAPLWRYHDVTTTARIVMPRIAGLEASGASNVVLRGFSSGVPLQVEASGSSSIEIDGSAFGRVATDVSGASRLQGRAQMEELAGEVSGGSRLELAGSATTLQLDVSGGSTVLLLELPAENADLALSGGSAGEVTVTGTLTVDASGGSRLEYGGSPQVAADTSGGSEVKPY
jgi:Putative auto-transporter adhesin, head GIN domain